MSGGRGEGALVHAWASRARVGEPCTRGCGRFPSRHPRSRWPLPPSSLPDPSTRLGPYRRGARCHLPWENPSRRPADGASFGVPKPCHPWSPLRNILRGAPGESLWRASGHSTLSVLSPRLPGEPCSLLGEGEGQAASGQRGVLITRASWSPLCPGCQEAQRRICGHTAHKGTSHDESLRVNQPRLRLPATFLPLRFASCLFSSLLFILFSFVKSLKYLGGDEGGVNDELT